MIGLADIRRIRNRAAFDRLVADQFDGSTAAFIDDLDRTVNALLRSDLKQARRLADSVDAIRSRLPKELAARCFAIRGRVCHWTGRYRDALVAYRRAWRLYTVQQDLTNRARLGRGLMDVHMYIGRHIDAIRIGRESLAFFRRKGMLRDAAMVMTNLGNVYHRLDDNRAALRYYDQARKIMASEGGVSLAIVEYNRANIFANMNEFETARSLYDAAAALYREAGLGIAEAQAKYSLAYLYFLEDRFSEAMRTLEQTCDQFTRLGDVKSAAVTKLDLCELDLQLNQYGAVIMAADEIIPEFHRFGMRYEEGKAHYFAAQARLRLGDFGPAVQQLSRSERLFERDGNQLWLGMVAVARCRIHIAQSRPAYARREASTALKCFTRSRDARRTVDAKALHMHALLAANQPYEAATVGRRLLKAKTVSYQRQEIYRLLGQALVLGGDDAGAADALQSAIAQLESMLRGLHPDEIRFFYVLDKFGLYREAAECLCRLGRIDDALDTSLLGLRLANERLPAASRGASGRVPTEFLAERSKLRALLRRHSSNPAAEANRPTARS